MTTVNSNAIPMLLASGERVLLQIATVSIQSLDVSVTITACVLLDSASQRAFMTDRSIDIWSRESKQCGYIHCMLFSLE